MSPAVISITIVAYFIILFTISYIAGRKADNEGFFVGNRKSAWYIVAFAMIGSTISGVTFVSVPGMVQASSFSYLQMVLGFIVGQIIIAFVLVPLFYRMNLVSIYEYLENRFGSSSYKTGAWFFFISKMLGAAVRLFLVWRFGIFPAAAGSVPTFSNRNRQRPGPTTTAVRASGARYRRASSHTRSDVVSRTCRTNSPR